MSDPLRTGELRDAALAAWAQQPARFREDANAEEDHARGYYRDRVVVELAQNAADAAARAGVPGRLLLRLVEDAGGGVLVAANTGAPLDAAGVASLASLRASAKREVAGAVGRFGVGFAAVRSVSDRVSVVSTTGAVHFDLAAAARALGPAAAADPVLADEVERRGAWLPVLRLPWAGPAGEHAALAPAGWDTVVVLTLRDPEAVALVRAQLALDDVLLLALPQLAEVTVEVDGARQVLADVAARWVVARREGVLDAALLADRPVEEQGRTGFQVTWAVRRGTPTPPGVVHAPTPTDEPCSLPALLIGTFPLDPTRRHVARGPLTTALLGEAARAWAELLVACRDDADAPDPATLLAPGLPAGRLDAALREAVLAATRSAPVLRTVCGGVVAPVDARLLTAALSPAAARLLGEAYPGLVHPAPPHLARVLALPTTDLADLVDALPPLAPVAARAFFEAFAAADPATLEHLGALPVPLADGRTVHGARGLVMLDEELAADAVELLAERGLRVVHPDAAHPLLERLGAERLGIVALLRSPAVRAAIADDADLLLTLVAAAVRGGPVESEAWWGEVPLPAADGERVPARGLVLAGSRAAELFDPEALPLVDPGVQARWGDAVLATVGVRADLVVSRVPADLTDGPAEPLDGFAEFRDDVGLDEVGEGGDVLVTADLDAVRPELWPQVLAELAHRHRSALEPLPLHRRGDDPSYTTWWLRHRSGLGLDRPFALPGGPAFLPAAPAVVVGLDETVQRWLGGVTAADQLTPGAWLALLSELPDGDPIPLPMAVEVWLALARLADEPGPLGDAPVLPALVALDPPQVRAVPTDDVVVASPMWAQLPTSLPAVVVPASAVATVADAMDLDCADERAAGRVTSSGEVVATADAVHAVFPGVPVEWVEHDDLRVDGVAVDWWVDDRVHAATTAGLARGLAERVGPRQAARIELLLGDAGATDRVLLDLAGEG